MSDVRCLMSDVQVPSLGSQDYDQDQDQANFFAVRGKKSDSDTQLSEESQHKRNFKPNGLFASMQRRNIKPNGLFSLTEKRFDPSNEQETIADFWAVRESVDIVQKQILR